MPGTIVFKPIEANISHRPESKDPVNSFCSFTIGEQKTANQISSESGSKPHWNDSVTLTVIDQPTCKVELKSEGVPSLGSFEIDLQELESKGTIRKWYDLKSEDDLDSGSGVLVEAIFTPDNSVTKSKPIKIGTKPNAETEYVPEEPSSHADVDPERIREEKAPQGNIPSGIDPDRIIQERSRWEMEPTNSISKIGETNEFGDYQPHKQLFHGDMKHEYGSGMMQQGSYYSGQQTSYGEAYPMSHKSVGTDQLHYMNPTAWISDRTNPFDYARYQQQAFLPHHNPLEEQSKGNTSVIEKAMNQARREAQRKHSAMLFQGAHSDGLSRNETQFSDQHPSVNPETQPPKTNIYVKDKEDQNNEMMSTNGMNLMEKDQMRPNTASTAMTNDSLQEI